MRDITGQCFPSVTYGGYNGYVCSVQTCAPSNLCGNVLCDSQIPETPLEFVVFFFFLGFFF